MTEMAGGRDNQLFGFVSREVCFLAASNAMKIRFTLFRRSAIWGQANISEANITGIFMTKQQINK
jgi:hypothetical protein